MNDDLKITLSPASEGANRDEDLKNSIEALMAVDQCCLANDGNGSVVFERIYAAANIIMAFLDALKTETDEVLRKAPMLASLLHVPFVTRLFELRRRFHDIAAAFDHPEDTVALVCWVDHIIAKLSSVTLALLKSASAKVDAPEDSLQTILKHRDESALHAASQLPHSWEDVPVLIGLEHASPAAVRLALHLLYAVYVIGPQLNSQSSKTSRSPCPAGLLRPLQNYIHKRHDSLAPGQRIAEAMAVSLFAAADMANEKQQRSSFRPHTQAILLSLIQSVLPPREADRTVLAPIRHPEPQLTALCGCGNTVEWCWTVWDDERITEYDVILCVTSTWLYHLGPPDHLSSWQTPLLDALARNPSAAGIAVTALLQHAKTQASSTQTLDEDALDVLLKCTQAAAWLLNACEDGYNGLCHQLCKTSCSLFISLGNTTKEFRVKDIIIELLSYIPSKLLFDSISELSKENGLKLKIRLDDKLRAVSRLSTDWSWLQCRTATHLLQFVTLVAHADIPMTTCFHLQSVLSLFKNVVLWLASPEAARMSEGPRLLQALLVALSVAEPSILEFGSDRRLLCWTDEDIWALAIDFEYSDVLTSSFASFVIASVQRSKCGPLWRVMGLDFLRDFLLELTELRHADENQTLFTYARTVTISAIEALVDHADRKTADYVLSSPWTNSLRAELGKLGDDGGHLSCRAVGQLATAVSAKISKLGHSMKTGYSEPASQDPRSGSGRRDGDRLLCIVLEDGPSLALLDLHA